MKKNILSCALLFSMASTSFIKAQAEPFLGQIAYVAFNFAPYGWLPCEGQILPIAQYQALYSLLGNTYGGDGQATFGLPDMRGRTVISEGKNPNNPTTYQRGQMGGSESVTLSLNQMPLHNHGVSAVTGEGNQSVPTGNLPANTKVLDKEYSDATADTKMKQTMIDPAGGSQPHENRSPYLTLKCIIAINGVYPTRQ